MTTPEVKPAEATPPPKMAWLARIVFGKKTKEPDHKNMTRELFETVVFVLVLVLLLQRFVAEAFVIPTGSMAETLYGDHVTCTCRECDFSFPINAADGGMAGRPFIHSYTCPNCGFYVNAETTTREDRDWFGTVRTVNGSPVLVPDFKNPTDAKDFSGVWSGDRVLVLKPAYDISRPRRFDVPVFKWPIEPFDISGRIPTNYIKRLTGLPGETIGVFDGDLYVTTDLKYEGRPRPEDPKDLWHYQFMYPSDIDALKAFDEGKFQIIRKEPRDILTQMIPVFDMDHLPRSQTGLARFRWAPDGGTNSVTIDDKGLSRAGGKGGIDWVKFQNLKKGWTEKPEPEPLNIADFLGYNEQRMVPESYVTDLIVECEYEGRGPTSVLVLELNKGATRYQAAFKPGSCLLKRIETNAGRETESTMGEIDCPVRENGRHRIRFANVDARLTVWVDGRVLPFGKAAEYDPNLLPKAPHPNDSARPVRVGLSGDATVRRLKVSRDLFYICGAGGGSNARNALQEKHYPPFNVVPACGDKQTFYVQPGHYIFFGDNSQSSLDSRNWGMVPERLLLGKAVTVYFPPSRMGVIR